MSDPIALLLVDHRVLFTDALAHLLAADGDFVVTVVRTGGEALATAATRPPRVAIVQLDLPGLGGLAAIRGLRALCPGTAVLGLAGSVEPGTGFQVLDAGASGLVSTTSPATDLVGAIRAAAAGRPLTPERRRASSASTDPRVGAERRAGNRRLTEREVDVLRLAATGLSNRRIAETLFLSEHTVLGYLKSLSIKLGVHSKLQAVVIGISEGLIPLPITEDGSEGESGAEAEAEAGPVSEARSGPGASSDGAR